MRLIDQVFGGSPFGPLVDHAKKVHECVKLVRPLLEAMAEEDYEKVHELQDKVSKLEYEADQVKHSIREALPRRFFLPVARKDFDKFLSKMDGIADSVEDFAVVLMIRKTKIHPDIRKDFFDFVDQIVLVSENLLQAAEELENLVETSFSGAEAKVVLDRVDGLGADEWKADRMQREISMKIHNMEDDLDPITIMFYGKMLETLSAVANGAENTGDLLREMIVKG